MPQPQEKLLYVQEHKHRGLVYRVTITAPPHFKLSALPFIDHFREQLHNLFDVHGHVVSAKNAEAVSALRQMQIAERQQVAA